jgi:D-alanyl-lipoteichoic acid acyltransferase DltB (MBOAT superfamily)
MFDIDWHKVLGLLAYNEDDPLLFNSGFFLFFFTIVLLFFQLVHKRKLTRVIVFSVFSLYFFYKCCGWYVGFMLLAATIDFGLSNWIYALQSKAKKTAVLVFSITINLGLLCTFKYTDLFINTWNEISGGTIQPLHWVIPVGISFYTFENLSYTLDVYRGHFKPVKNFADYLFFLSFFPKLVMGPIVRASDFIPQIRQETNITREDVGRGLYLILSGLFRKVVISDYLQVNFVQYIFDDPSKHSGVECLFGVYAYALVIYCDFSGYSDMAIGMAKWMGFRIPPNFDSPYQSGNITEFWRRWHISLSSWLRDYLYISLGGNRGGSAGTYIISGLFFAGSLVACITWFAGSGLWWPLLLWLAMLLLFVLPPLIGKKGTKGFASSLNLLNTMLLGGLWHGASWNFMLWGLLHGVALAVDKLRKAIIPDNKNKLLRVLGVIVTFHFVCYAWVYFKAADFEQASVLLGQIFNNFGADTFVPMMEGYAPVMIVLGIGYLLHFTPKFIEERTQLVVSRVPFMVRLALILGMMWLVIQVKQAEQVMPIYLQF